MNSTPPNRNVIEVDEKTLTLLNLIERSYGDDIAISILIDNIPEVNYYDFVFFLTETNSLDKPGAAEIMSILLRKERNLINSYAGDHNIEIKMNSDIGSFNSSSNSVNSVPIDEFAKSDLKKKTKKWKRSNWMHPILSFTFSIVTCIIILVIGVVTKAEKLFSYLFGNFFFGLSLVMIFILSGEVFFKLFFGNSFYKLKKKKKKKKRKFNKL